MASVVKNNILERVLSLFQALNTEQLIEVMHFIEFLKVKERENGFEDLFLARIVQEADPEVTLDQVRTKLSSITGDLSDVVITGREERL